MLFPEFCTNKNVNNEKIAPAGGKVLYCPLELLYHPLQLLEQAVKYCTARWTGAWSGW
jgi:hypothetical protein